MKILYIVTQADGGGAQKYALELAKHFKGALAAGKEATRLFKDASDLGLSTYPLTYLRRNINPFYDLLAIFEIRRLIKTLSPDIVHLNSTKAGFLGSLAAAGLKTKLVFTAHGFRFLEPLGKTAKLFYLWTEKFASHFRDFIITVSGVDRNAALKHKLIAKHKIKTVYNGLPPLTFFEKDEARAQLKLPQNIILIGTVANFYKTKGLDIFVKAASLLHPSILDKCKFLIIGDGPEFKNIKLEIENLGLNNSFLLTKNIPNAYKYLKAFNIFVLPSRKEGFPYSLLEAMQAGLPVVGTNVGGVKEALGEAGLIAPPVNPKALADSIGQLLRNKELTEDLANKALERSKIFSQNKMLEETKNVYNLLQIKTRPPV